MRKCKTGRKSKFLFSLLAQIAYPLKINCFSKHFIFFTEGFWCFNILERLVMKINNPAAFDTLKMLMAT